MERVIAENRAAFYNYFIKETIECGIVLYGPEVKSLRHNRANIGDAYADFTDNEAFLYKLHIPEYKCAKFFKEDPKRPRKLLLHRRQIKYLLGLTSKKGMTLIPIKMYFNKKNIAKILIGISQGRKKADKREAIKKRDIERMQKRFVVKYNRS